MNTLPLTLFWQLLRRDIQERYTGTVLGAAWLVIQPVLMLLVYALVFGEVLQLRFGEHHTDGQFAAYLFAGLMAFNALAEVVTRAPSLLVERRELLLYSALSPALLPLLPVAVSLGLEAISLGLLLAWLLIHGQWQPWGWVFYLPFVVARLLLSLALSYWLAVLGVFLRDLRQLMPPLLGVLLLISAVVYPPELVPESLKVGLLLNPVAQLVQGYRDALLEGRFRWETWLGLMLLASGLLFAGRWLFQRLMPRARYVL